MSKPTIRINIETHKTLFPLFDPSSKAAWDGREMIVKADDWHDFLVVNGLTPDDFEFLWPEGGHPQMIRKAVRNVAA
jgi:hypothetical protein